MATMAIKTGERQLTEAEIYASDLDEGIVDVETYPIPDGSEIADPYLRRIWAGAKAMIEGGEEAATEDGVAENTPDRYSNAGEMTPKQYTKQNTDHVKTVAIDLDGTLATYEGWQGEEHFGRVRPHARETLQALRDRGCRIIIWTTRGNKTLVAEWLDSHDLIYDYINENPDQPKDSSEKVIADLYIDDRAIDGSKSWQAIQEELDHLKYQKSDVLPGGLADSRPDSDFDPDALARGVQYELEHTDNPDVAREIAKDHLAEDPEYYEKLEFMESSKTVEIAESDDDAPEDNPADTLADRVAKAARKTDRNPSDEQKAAGNYRKGKCRIHGLEIAIENPAGSTRSGRNKATGEEWSIKLPYHYGYIKRTESEADGDHIDVFLGPDLDSEVAFIIDQTKPPAHVQFDEHKCMIGWKSAAAAKAAYHECYSDGWSGFDAITPMTIPQFREWCERGDTGKRVAQRPEANT
jgi:hypothetical protein